MTLSDQFCVDRHKANFLDLVKNKLDICFANEGEMMSLIDAKDFSEVINFSKEIKKEFQNGRRKKSTYCVYLL